jgi:hypothetical protein
VLFRSKNILRHRFWPGVRPYKTENLYLYLEKEGKSIANQNKTTGRAGAPASGKRTNGKGKQG